MATHNLQASANALLKRPALSVRQRILVWVASGNALCSDSLTDFFLDLAFRNRLPVLELKEVILQNYLFCGFPNAIEGLILLQKYVDRHSVSDENYIEKRTHEEIQRDGISLCKKIYGKNFDKLMGNMQKLSVNLHQWMISEGYGKVLSRPILNPQERELCIISTLITLQRERQLISHIRGAQNAGASEEEIRETILSLEPILNTRIYTKAQKVLHKTI